MAQNIVDSLCSLGTLEREKFIGQSEYFQIWLSLQKRIEECDILRNANIIPKLIWHPAITKAMKPGSEMEPIGIDYPTEIVNSLALVIGLQFFVFDAVYLCKPIAFLGRMFH